MQDARIGTFDGLDNRKWLWRGLEHLGHGLDERRAGMVRARFLRSLLDDAESAWVGHPIRLEPMSVNDAYLLVIQGFVSGFGVTMEAVSRRLEAALRAQR
jgi:hypothetical protein